MLQLYPVYLLWNRPKTLTGSPDPTLANGTNKPCSNRLKELNVCKNFNISGTRMDNSVQEVTCQHATYLYEFSFHPNIFT